jgi:transposase InsO family protein
MQGEKVVCDVSTSQPRPIIPVADRRDVFRAIHVLAHAGIRATRRLMTARVVWRGMSSDVSAWCRDCQLCARGKATCTWTWLALSLHRRRGSSTLQTMAAEDCVDALISSWVARFAVPTIITSDQGRQFTSSLWAGLTKLLGIKHVQTTAYHPQSNGMVERTHRQLKAALRARLGGSRWPEHLPWVLLGLRTAPKEDSGISAAFQRHFSGRAGVRSGVGAAGRVPLHSSSPEASAG